MKPIRFYLPNQLGASFMRGKQISFAMDKKGYDSKCITKVDDQKDAIIVFVKGFNPQDLIKAKEQGNICVLDVVDKFASLKSRHDEIPYFPIFDHAIFCNEFTRDYFQNIFQSTSVILHHWDPRLQKECGYYAAYPYQLRIGYIGYDFNHSFAEQLADVVPIYNPNQWVDWAPFFTAHYNVKDNTELETLFKPTTKISTAAAVNANILVMKDPNTVELIGDDYPYYVKEYKPEVVFESIKLMQDTFEDELWYDALKTMKGVRDRTSLDTVSDEYINLFKHLTGENADEAA